MIFFCSMPFGAFMCRIERIIMTMPPECVPPRWSRVSRSSTLAPFLAAAMAATKPDVPPPTTRTSLVTVRDVFLVVKLITAPWYAVARSGQRCGQPMRSRLGLDESRGGLPLGDATGELGPHQRFENEDGQDGGEQTPPRRNVVRCLERAGESGCDTRRTP